MELIVNAPLKMIGYWGCSKIKKDDRYYEEYKKYPNPKDFIDPNYWRGLAQSTFQNFEYNLVRPDDNIKLLKQHIANYLDRNIECNKYFGYSGCRICGVGLGSTERTDGVWLWPDGLSHYVLEHDIYLPEEFIEHVFKEGIHKCYKDYETDTWVNSMNRRKVRRVHFIRKWNTSLFSVLKEYGIVFNINGSHPNRPSWLNEYKNKDVGKDRHVFYNKNLPSWMTWSKKECEKLVRKKKATRVCYFSRMDNDDIKAYIKYCGKEEIHWYENEKVILELAGLIKNDD